MRVKKRDTKISLVVLINFFPTRFSDASRRRNVLGTFFHKRTLINTLFSLLFIMFLQPFFFVGVAGLGRKRKLFVLMLLKKGKDKKHFHRSRMENKNKGFKAAEIKFTPNRTPLHHPNFQSTQETRHHEFHEINFEFHSTRNTLWHFYPWEAAKWFKQVDVR